MPQGSLSPHIRVCSRLHEWMDGFLFAPVCNGTTFAGIAVMLFLMPCRAEMAWLLPFVALLIQGAVQCKPTLLKNTVDPEVNMNIVSKVGKWYSVRLQE